ncbi:endo-1,4-beta-xylanase [Mangrovibacterium lignilyticum]|uniref:endo-1,4-beta-xylanase n=1 Tax=Mangrovibacterium lignilyticum TaxID=2668052 RepID=UPI0019686DB2|nr:endo-1,4-beta-xylanase [Mangrovibacterium lignilyticum]
MKYLNKILLGAVTLSVMVSCVDDSLLDYKVEKPESIAKLEYLNDYDVLKSYVDRSTDPDFKLGAGVSVGDFNKQGLAYSQIVSNFDEITAGWEMKHGAVVQSDGSLDLTSIEKFAATAQEGGLSIFGHTLCWHANQNATYLNGVIAPLAVEPQVIANSLDRSGLEDGSFNGWGTDNSGDGITIETGGGMAAGTDAIKLVASSASSEATELQLTTPDVTLVEGHAYKIILYIKSDQVGEGRLSFQGLSNNTPSKDWMGTGAATETFVTQKYWKKVECQVNDFEAGTFKVNLDLGYQPGVTYYVDVDNFFVIDTQGEASFVNLINNGDFEAGNINGWGGWGNSSTRTLSADGEGYGGSGYCIKVYNPSAVNFWEVQSAYTFDAPLEEGEEYVLSFYIRHDNPNGDIRPELQSSSWQDGADGFGTVYLNNDWTKVELPVTPTSGERINLIISYGSMAGTVYMDNFVLAKASGGSSEEGFVVEKSDEAKKELVDAALTDWISKMVTNTKDYVKAWDVVNEPMDDGSPYDLKSGIGKTDLAADEFYWQDYLGKDYAVMAFNLAAQYGNSDDKLFINDYNLEYNLDKCKGLIAYVAYIESKGARVDGIGTQMHINVSSDKDKISQMFELLAATGKLIKISELDIGIDGTKTSEATDEDYQAQAEMYKYVVQKYFELIPAAQRYGITAWSPLDSPASSSWRAGEPIGLWAEGYSRKPAYGGFADGFESN